MSSPLKTLYGVSMRDAITSDDADKVQEVLAQVQEFLALYGEISTLYPELLRHARSLGAPVVRPLYAVAPADAVAQEAAVGRPLYAVAPGDTTDQAAPEATAMPMPPYGVAAQDAEAEAAAAAPRVLYGGAPQDSAVQSAAPIPMYASAAQDAAGGPITTLYGPAVSDAVGSGDKSRLIALAGQLQSLLDQVKAALSD